jgi:hypothetical protein
MVLFFLGNCQRSVLSQLQNPLSFKPHYLSTCIFSGFCQFQVLSKEDVFASEELFIFTVTSGSLTDFFKCTLCPELHNLYQVFGYTPM